MRAFVNKLKGITSGLFLLLFIVNYAQAPAGYYDAAAGKTGYQLKTALKDIITNGHTDQGYAALYDLYQNADVDNYYENDGTLLDMYSENPAGADAYEYTQPSDECGTYQAEGNCYNREHLMPQSAFNSAAPMKNDGHFVVPADGYVNNRRSNYPFGIVTNPTWTSSNGSKVGPNSTSGYSGTVFEPIDEFKGDIARMLFYVATRYEDQIAGWNSDMLNGTSDQVFADWFLQILLQWHHDDPVSQREIDRNEAVYNFQGNRNPFIDHPEWVDSIWNNQNNNNGQLNGNTVIAIQDFEGTSPQWNYTEHDAGYNCFNTATGYQGNSTTSLRIKGTNKHDADPYIELQNIDISSYTGVQLEVYFAAHGPDSQDDLWLDISYDNGSTWNSTKLVDGYNNANLNFGDTNPSDPTTVSSNPYVVNISDSETQIMVRIRFDERGTKNNTSDYYYVDDIKLTGTSSTSSDTPDWCNLQWPPDGNVRSGDGFTVYAQVYEPGVTDASGQGSGIQAWIGYSTVDNDPSDPANDSDWHWVSATYNTDSGNNDEYVADLEGAITGSGTYYYASRFSLNGGPYVYGGYNGSGGGFWDSPYSGSGSNKSGKLTIDVVDWCNLQHPENGSITAPGNSFTVYAQIYEEGLTNASNSAAGAGIQAWIGYSTVDNDPSDPANASDWTWVPATYNTDSGNNDKFMADLGSQISQGGTYYYASRFQINGGPYAYGGYNGGFWQNTYASGGSNKSGQLTVNDIYFSNITHTPASVHSTDQVNVSADVTADAGVGGVELHWGTASGSLNNTISMSNTGGNTYTTDNPIPAQPSGTTVYYEIYALDNNAEEATSAEQSYTVTDVCASELIISEYIEGSGNNKYLEIYNGTGADVNMDDYDIRIYSNGSSTVSTTIHLNNVTLSSGNVYVIAHSSATAWNGSPDQTTNNLNFNGDDAVELYNTATGQSVDIIGQIGTDPGSHWGSGSTSTLDHTLVRKDYITSGDTDGSDAFDPATEWTGYAQDDVSHLGAHTMNCNCTAPDTDAVFHANSPQNITTTSVTLNWTSGNGTKRIVVIRQGSAVSFVPTDGTTYAADPDLSSATDVSGNGEYVIYNGNGSTVDVTGLTPGTLYYVKIYEYNCSAGNEKYFTGGTPAEDSFYTNPEAPASLTNDCTGSTSVHLSWTPPATGNYDGYLLVVREGATPHSPGSLDPNTNLGDNTDYTAAATYGSTTPYSRILYKGTSTSAVITGLTNNTDYTFQVFAYSANGSIYRYSDPKQITVTVLLNDVTDAMTSPDNLQITVGWTNPGTSCFDEILVVANETAGIDFTPMGDGSSYTANNNYAGPNSIVYKGTGNQVTVTGLTNGTTYYFEIFVRSGTEWSQGVEVFDTPQLITHLEPGDLAILAVNTDIDNKPGAVGDGSGDQIAFVCFKDLYPGTKIYLTDNGYEREVAGKWGNTEGVISITRTGTVLPAGTIIVIETNDQTTGNIKSPDHFDIYTCGSIDNNWDKEFVAGTGGFNLNNDDDVWIMQGGIWLNGTNNYQDATYSGNVLYGWTESGWDNGVGNGTDGTRWSNLYPHRACFTTTAPASGGKVKFNDPNDPDFSSATNDKLDWIALINTSANWDTYTDNSSYDSGGFDYKGDSNCPQMTIANNTHTAGKWTGQKNNNWFDCSNWDNLTLPDENTDVEISSAASSEAVIDASADYADLYGYVAKTRNLTIQDGLWLEVNTSNDTLKVFGNLTIQNNALLDLNDNNNATLEDGQLFLYGNWINQYGSSGFDSGNGTVHFVGTTPQTIQTADAGGNEIFYNVVLDNDFDLSVSGNIIANGFLKVENGKNLIISDNTFVKVGKDIINNGNITVENHGSLVQTDDNGSISGSGTFKMNKTSLPLGHFWEYVYWSSPINSGALQLGDVVPGAWRYYTFDATIQDPSVYPNTGWTEKQSTDVFVAGQGVAISAPETWTGSGTLAVSFVKNSDPFNNGIIQAPVYINGAGASDGDDWNLLGNPYPSAIDFAQFVQDNNKVQGAYYLWTNCAGLDAQGHHQSSGYTVFSAGLQAGTAACSGTGNAATNYIASGQGFFIEANANGQVSFNNSQRVTGNNTNLLNRDAVRDLIWLNLNGDDVFNQILLGFVSGATEQYDRLYDARHMLTGDAYFYFIQQTDKLVIEGLPAWDDTERHVPLGFYASQAGNFSIAIDSLQGVLEQVDVYLHDMNLDIFHDLKTSEYTFYALAGDDETRFELVFVPQQLGTENLHTGTTVFTDETGVLHIKSSGGFNGVQIYDLAGRILMQQNFEVSTGKHFNIRNLPPVFLVKIHFADGTDRVQKLINR